MNRRFHARLARRLIKAVGTLEEAAEVCRVKKSQLSDYQNPYGEDFMPADVIEALEEDCGDPIYSRALFECRQNITQARDLREKASETIEAAADMGREVRLATRDGLLTPAEIERIAARHAETALRVREVGEIISRADTA